MNLWNEIFSSRYKSTFNLVSSFTFSPKAFKLPFNRNHSQTQFIIKILPEYIENAFMSIDFAISEDFLYNNDIIFKIRASQLLPKYTKMKKIIKTKNYLKINNYAEIPRDDEFHIYIGNKDNYIQKLLEIIHKSVLLHRLIAFAYILTDILNYSGKYLLYIIYLYI